MTNRLKAKKALGQHFLHDEAIARKIAHCLPITKDQNVLEVGPGKGILSKYLLAQTDSLKCVELDRDIIKYLAEHEPHLHDRTIESDFLKLALEKVFGESFFLIGNYPYNISSQIVFRMLKYRDLIPHMAGMFQREMAERIVAKPGGKEYGVISILTQAYYDAKILFTVKNGVFTPPPKVQSAVIKLDRKDDQELGCDYQVFRRVVKQAFSQRRKMLRNTMKSLFKDKEFLQQPFFNQRPEQLSIADFVYLANELEKQEA